MEYNQLVNKETCAFLKPTLNEFNLIEQLGYQELSPCRKFETKLERAKCTNNALRAILRGFRQALVIKLRLCRPCLSAGRSRRKPAPRSSWKFKIED